MKIIHLDNGEKLEWAKIVDDKISPSIPFGTKVKINLTYDDADFINGTDGIVWSTYSRFQADTIKNTLLVQDIFSEIKTSNPEGKILYQIYIPKISEVEKAIDFIWRDSTGLRLIPDWHYSTDKENESFNKWLSNS